MGMLTTQARIAELKAELQRAESEVVVSSTPIEQLQRAKAAAAEARRLLTINIGQSDELVQHIAGLGKSFYLAEGSEKRASINAETQRFRDKLKALSDERVRLERDVRETEISVSREKEVIAKHSTYAAVRDEHNKLLAEGLQLLYRLYRTPFGDLQPVMWEIERLIEKEIATVACGRARLRHANLPELTPRLKDFFNQVLPMGRLATVVAWDGGGAKLCAALEDAMKQDFRT
jgi:chromosome segregation ATPase